MIIDYVLQPGIQLVLGFSMVASLYLLISKDKINKKLHLAINILGFIGIYHYFILPVIFVHEFGAYEGLDYRNIFKDENNEPRYSNILFRKDKHSTLEAVSGLVDYVKQEKDLTTYQIIDNAYDLKDKERIQILSEKIDEN